MAIANIRFRLVTGEDIGPKQFPLSTPVSAVKESVLADWPQKARAVPPGGNRACVCALCTETPKRDRTSQTDLGPAQLMDPWDPTQGEKGPPSSILELKLILAGRVLDNAMTLSEARTPAGGELVTMHVVVSAKVCWPSSVAGFSRRWYEKTAWEINCPRFRTRSQLTCLMAFSRSRRRKGRRKPRRRRRPSARAAWCSEERLPPPSTNVGSQGEPPSLALRAASAHDCHSICHHT